MKKAINGEQGAALAMTLITIAVLMILGTAFLYVSSTENRFAGYSEDKTQAYYIARAGAQSVAERLIKGDNVEFIIGETSEYHFAGGKFSVEVKESVIVGDAKLVDIISVGSYNDITQTVTIRVEGSALGAGMFSNAFYAYGDVTNTGNLSGAEIIGDIRAGGIIDLSKLPSNVKTESPVTYPVITTKIPDFASSDIISITTSKTLTAPTIKKVTGISLNNQDLIINGNGVVSLFLYGDANIKGDIIIPVNTQLHIYVIGKHTLNIQGSAETSGKIFIYGPDAKVEYNSTTDTSFKGLIIAHDINLHSKIKFAYDPTVYDSVIQENWIDTSNIGVGYTGYTWISNN